MLPEYPNFKSLELEDLSQINKHFASTNHQICELAPANLFIWQEFDHPKLTLINNNLCILVTPPNEPSFFLEPIGKNKLLDTVNICLKDCGKIARASEDFLFHLPIEHYHVKCDRNQFDYIYEIKTLAELKGRKNDGKRNHIKNFKKRHPNYAFISLNKKDKEKALGLFEDWFSIRKDSRHFPKLAYSSQRVALEKAFEYFDALKMAGGAVYIDNVIKGFIMGSALNKQTACAHFQYGHPSVRGIFQILLWEACNKTFKSQKYINLEQDLGIPGLRKAKTSYYPERMIKKFEIEPVT